MWAAQIRWAAKVYTFEPCASEARWPQKIESPRTLWTTRCIFARYQDYFRILSRTVTGVTEIRGPESKCIQNKVEILKFQARRKLPGPKVEISE